ncbi:alpha/beta hydrolase family protein [Aspergillus undulatus]|uniref:alpha/beta hydrolase family protein n=1 Tax=Aspergillus undulatus TaxID=1810928 RepID=UPI003CCE32EE
MSLLTIYLSAPGQVAILGASVSAAPEINFPSGCDSVCQTAFNQAHPIDASFWVSPNVTAEPFYQTPKDFGGYSVGDLVKWEDISPEDVSGLWWVPSGLALSRFLYVSEDVDDKPLPATAYVLMPYHNPLGEDKPFRVVVWAHGTAGFIPQCAPSNDKRLQYHWQAPFALAEQGYIVIAPDYAGQGTQIPQGFMYNAGIPHAADVSNAVNAARQEFPDLMSPEWVVAGHSEGGLTAWRTAQREADKKKAIGGFIGAVAIAPAMEVMTLVPWVIEKAKGGPLNDIYVPFMLRSIARLFPSFDLAKYATKKLIDLSTLSTNACLNVALPLLMNLTLPDMYHNNANFTSAPEVLEWDEKYQGKGASELAGPLLVLHGEKDFIIPHSHIETIFDEQCDVFPDSRAHYTLLPGLDHDGAVQASHWSWFPWIADRFNEKELEKGCTKDQVSTATDRFSSVEQAWVSGGQILAE